MMLAKPLVALDESSGQTVQILGFVQIAMSDTAAVYVDSLGYIRVRSLTYTDGDPIFKVASKGDNNV